MRTTEYARCHVCGKVVSMTYRFTLRKHKSPYGAACKGSGEFKRPEFNAPANDRENIEG